MIRVWREVIFENIVSLSSLTTHSVHFQLEMTLRGISPVLLFHLMTGVSSAAMIHPVSALSPILRQFIPAQATIVPLGYWTPQDYAFLCSAEFAVSEVFSIFFCALSAETELIFGQFWPF